MPLVRARFTSSLAVLFAFAAMLLSGTSLWAQSAAEPENLSFTTKDGVQIKGTYYPSDVGEQAVPVIMLHDANESRAVFADFARLLQSPVLPNGQKRDSRAVVTIDLRGHGDSRTAIGRNGATVELDGSNFRTSDYAAMVLQDMEAVRKFLVEKNNAHDLNLNKLCLIGSGMGANVATIWAARDWSMPPLARVKQGQDVKALVLISPRWSFRGLPLKDAIRQPGLREGASFFVAYGNEDGKFKSDARNIHKNLERYHPEPPRDQIREKKTLYFNDKLDTSLQGSELLTKPQFKLFVDIDVFIERRLVNQDFPWIDRKLQ
ncbi:alpha/beta hydrolase [Adhaeretor mobilis]|uniref:Alpha/beta hydrolase family protein n=1 Tax=Adhaeretor mobilis TaxID=1930276 RepID=A0A517N054_9BACT|nr:alpha/beta fold hydrolase [Adhaeretor mobilis]QDT00519.1 Alpha/beta hydrolase family protein [Adhaeretor mobilis]